jgi:hypothetical protein
MLAGKIPSPIFTKPQRSNLTNRISKSDTSKKQENLTRRNMEKLNPIAKRQCCLKRTLREDPTCAHDRRNSTWKTKCLHVPEKRKTRVPA